MSPIGRLPGRGKVDATARYVHPALDSVEASSARVAVRPPVGTVTVPELAMAKSEPEIV